MSLNLIITEAGRAALLNAQQTGTDAVTITEAGLSATAVAPVPGLTALAGELRRIATVGGTSTADDIIHVSMLDDSNAAYSLRSFALYLDDGTLFAIYGQADPILIKTAESAALIAIDCVFADISAASLAFGATNFTDPDATTARKGLIEIATNAEAQAGADASRAVTPAALAAALLPLLLARDGAGSGLDADLLDGQQGAWYTDIAARLGYTPLNKAGDIMTGSLGLNLPNFFLAGSGTRASINFDANDWLSFDRSLNRLLIGIAGSEAPVWHGGNDGAGSGLDADLLDGQDSSFFTNIPARLGYTPVNKAGDTMTGPLTLPGDPTATGHAARKGYVDALTTGAAILARLLGVDGSGSGLDADLLDGLHASQFLRITEASIGANGYIQLAHALLGPDLIFQWRNVACTAGGASAFTWPKRFPNALLGAVPGGRQGLNFSGSYSAYLNGANQDGGFVYGNNGGGVPSTVTIFALGN